MDSGCHADFPLPKLDVPLFFRSAARGRRASRRAVYDE